MLKTNNLGMVYDPQHGGDNLALIDCRDWESPQSITHRQLSEAADACARGLLARGLRRGDRVAILSANRSEFLTAYLGTLRAGMVSVPINYKFPPATIEFVLADAQVDLALCDDQRQDSLPTAVERVCFDDHSDNGYAGLLAPGPFQAVSPETREPAMILYTSGSTGRPKGVPLSHDGHLWALRQRITKGWPFSHHRLLVAAPLYHMNALCVSLVALGSCASEVLLPQFDPHRYLQAIERFGCTWITSVPTMLAMCFQYPEAVAETDLRSVSVVRMGSAPVSPKLQAQVESTFAGASIMNGYGTTEAGPVVFGPLEGRSPPPMSVGWPSPGVDVKLIDNHGQEAEQGVLWHRTPATMTAYLNLPEKTREVLTEDGWYISGDVFRRDGDGAYYFVGRVDDMFNCGGENIYPGEVEALLVSHPDVIQACVVPVDDDIKGAKPVAYVVARPGSKTDPETLKQFTLANGPAYQHPRTITFVDELPLAGPGKVDRRVLLERARSEA